MRPSESSRFTGSGQLIHPSRGTSTISPSSAGSTMISVSAPLRKLASSTSRGASVQTLVQGAGLQAANSLRQISGFNSARRSRSEQSPQTSGAAMIDLLASIELLEDIAQYSPAVGKLAVLVQRSGDVGHTHDIPIGLL